MRRATGTRRRTYRRKKRKIRWGRIFWLMVFLAALAAAYYYYNAETKALEDTAGRFMTFMETGELDSASLLLYRKDQGMEEISELMHRHRLEYNKVISSRLTALDRGKGRVVFMRDGEEYHSSLELIRERGEWLISGLPQFDILHGAYVVRELPDKIELFYRGEEQAYRISKPLHLNRGEVIFMIALEGKLIISEKAAPEPVSRIMIRSGGHIEGEMEGLFELHDPYSIYRVDANGGSVSQGYPSDLIVGRSGIVFHIYEEKVLAAEVEVPYRLGHIRVVLNDSSKENLHHNTVTLSATAPLSIQEKVSGREYGFGAHSRVTVTMNGENLRVVSGEAPPLELSNRIYFSTEQGGRIMIHSLRRDGWGGEAPAYRGVLEVKAHPGGIFMVNEIPLEEYLFSVVPSEMPASFGLEPLKAQAVAARSYAYRSILASSYRFYGAHVDDSISSQVYNNYRENDITNRAIEETRGLVPFYRNNVVDARFFSTSCGVTANFEEVWHDTETGDFPGKPVPYLRFHSQVPGTRPNLSGENRLQDFLLKDFPEAYDRVSPYFRWKIEMTHDEIKTSIEKNLSSRHKSQPDFVLTREGAGFVSREIPGNPLGELLDLRVLQRGEAGNMMILEIEGTNGTYRIIKEYNIRFTLRPVAYSSGGSPVMLELSDGSGFPNYPILPSAFAFFHIEREGNGRMARVAIHGGGNGHGVGLSQYGARGMAEEGFGFREILEHYYPGSDLTNIYQR